jgi:pyruvate/2-oxoglutarate dehydrogenase complex dihydrolipoamide acyltransferase (E2) component
MLGDRPGEIIVKGAASATAASIDADARKVATVQTISAVKPDHDSTDSAEAGLPAKTLSAHEIAASPRGRRLAKELGIDINAVQPARGKRIVEEDVRRYHESRQAMGAEDRPAKAEVHRP